MSMRHFLLYISCHILSYICGQLAMPKIFLNKKLEYANIKYTFYDVRYVYIEYTYSFTYVIFFFHLIIFSCNYMGQWREVGLGLEGP